MSTTHVPPLSPLEQKSVMHPWHDVSPDDGDLPKRFQAIVEIPLGSSHKYELDKNSGLLRLDRVLHSAVHYPANYGFIPQTLAEDGDPLDVLVYTSTPVVPLVLLSARVIGLMTMKDQGELDHKIIAVHAHDPDFNGYTDITQLPAHRLLVLRRFFEDYKTLENKTVVVDDILPAANAYPVVEHAFESYRRWKTAAL